MCPEEEHCPLAYHGKKARQPRKGGSDLEDRVRLQEEGENYDKKKERSRLSGLGGGAERRGCDDQKRHAECLRLYQGSNRE